MPTLPPEPNGKGSLACARSPLASTSHAECQPEVEVQHARFECTPRSEFTAISNNSTSVNPYGTRIGKNHSSYLLMYYMLTGIRSAVLKGEEKYTQIAAPSFEGIDKKTCKKRVKLSLENKETTGGCCSCSKRKSREFRDYAPIAFRFLRKQFFIDTEDYLTSLTPRYVLSELGSPGRSGSFFYYSHDYRFLIKTIGKVEHSSLLSLLPDYCAHVKRFPNTLLTRFLGLHRISGLRPGSPPIYFVVMGNVFPPSKDIHEIYDLKGSFHGRQVSVRKLTRCPREPRKDLNWLRSGKKLLLSPRKAALVMTQLEHDVEFLTSCNIMDYSLLVGIHSIQRGNRERIRDKALSVFETAPIEEGHANQPADRDLTSSNVHRHHKKNKRRYPSSIKSALVGFARPLTQEDPICLMEQSDDAANRSATINQLQQSSLPSFHNSKHNAPAERSNFVFYSEEGGILSGTEEAFRNPVTVAPERPTEIYYLGIIDILTPYSCKKQIEHAFKSFRSSSLSISAVSPAVYSRRFLAFMRRCVLNQENSNSSSIQTSKQIEKYLTLMISQSEYELSLASSMVTSAAVNTTTVQPYQQN
ncbi:hypothetical protein DI09_15p230 [Mitosporidium daphniae]|uniref:PIPK domain-containing protein n=1 Tax=Mitosporidium daphniae TaxID=1485682 RepID=A0A098VXR4_9MICR|nr:uncharacterized protein DI09_15p230 [Mitosporidium daphniae]KGG52556.1 hypothetical protein DI09_15p230 [Mitosporidium daphniae]|eukprot:XP_013238983.1 uncharacterized protein DI09_15p230 [Mitosporidium daphniae]